MRILFITNYYPPSKYGWGYMQLCEEVAERLHMRGHQIAVLTSTYRDGAEIVRSYPVYRLLHLNPDWNSRLPVIWQFFINRKRQERSDLASFRRITAEFKPEVVFVWHAFGLSRLILKEAEQMPGVTVAYYLAGFLPEVPDEYIPYWQHVPERWLARLLKRPLAKLSLWQLRREGRPIRLRYDHVICVSRYVRDHLVSQGLIPDSAVVIYNGIDLNRFSPNRCSIPLSFDQGLRCLIAGRIVPEKGVHTAVQAFAKLHRDVDSCRATLTILGDGPRDYMFYLNRLIEDNSLHRSINFQLPVPRDRMPEMLACHNVLLLPSEYQEPLARSMQEAMALGLLVIGTTTGGSGELLVHDQTGLVFQAGDAGSLAIQLGRVLENPARMRQLALAGQQEVRARFDIRRTVEGIESYLAGVVSVDRASGRE